MFASFFFKSFLFQSKRFKKRFENCSLNIKSIDFIHFLNKAIETSEAHTCLPPHCVHAQREKPAVKNATKICAYLQCRDTGGKKTGEKHLVSC